jgi:hypothetical protein
MSQEKKLNVSEVVNDIKQIHQKEKEIFPSDIASLAPARNYISDKLIKAHLLKYFQDNLSLFDYYKVEDEQEFIKKSIKLNDVYEKSVGGAPFAFTLYYLLYKKAPLLHLNSYIKHLYPISLIFAGTYLLANLGRNGLIGSELNKFNSENKILNSKAELHTNIVRLSNSLKYPDNELH